MQPAEEVAPEPTTSRLDDVLAAAARAEARRGQLLSTPAVEAKIPDGEVAEVAAVGPGAEATNEADALEPQEDAPPEGETNR